MKCYAVLLDKNKVEGSDRVSCEIDFTENTILEEVNLDVKVPGAYQPTIIDVESGLAVAKAEWMYLGYFDTFHFNMKLSRP